MSECSEFDRAQRQMTLADDSNLPRFFEPVGCSACSEFLHLSPGPETMTREMKSGNDDNAVPGAKQYRK
jgi:hypothetical protein